MNNLVPGALRLKAAPIPQKLQNNSKATLPRITKTIIKDPKDHKHDKKDKKHKKDKKDKKDKKHKKEKGEPQIRVEKYRLPARKEEEPVAYQAPVHQITEAERKHKEIAR